MKTAHIMGIIVIISDIRLIIGKISGPEAPDPAFSGTPSFYRGSALSRYL